MNNEHVLTPLQLKCINYVRGCEKPPNRKEVALYLSISPEAANGLLARLEFYGYLKSFTERGKSKQMERFYVFVSMKRTKFQSAEKRKNTLKINFMYNDPFNLSGARACRELARLVKTNNSLL